MNEMRKLMEAVQQLDEYFVRTGESVGDMFDMVFGQFFDKDGDGSGQGEAEYLEELGFHEAAETIRELLPEINGIKRNLKPYWDQKITNDEMIGEIDNAAGPYLEASSEYDDEDDYLDRVVPSIRETIELFDSYGVDAGHYLVNDADEYGSPDDHDSLDDYETEMKKKGVSARYWY